MGVYRLLATPWPVCSMHHDYERRHSNYCSAYNVTWLNINIYSWIKYTCPFFLGGGGGGSAYICYQVWPTIFYTLTIYCPKLNRIHESYIYLRQFFFLTSIEQPSHAQSYIPTHIYSRHRIMTIKEVSFPYPTPTQSLVNQLL